MILELQNHFGGVSIILVGSNLFWFFPNHFGQVQVIKIGPEKSNINLTKTVWTVQTHFGSMEGHGINLIVSV